MMPSTPKRVPSKDDTASCSTKTTDHRKPSSKEAELKDNGPEKNPATVTPQRRPSQKRSHSASATPKALRGRPSRDLCHTAEHPSLLSRQNTHLNLRGLLNLLIIIVIAQNARLVLENLIKYGVRIKPLPPSSFQDLVENWPILLSLILMHGSFFGAFWLERYVNPWLAANDPRGYTLLSSIVTWSNATMVLLVPYFTIKFSKAEPVSASFLLAFSITWFLKLVSFHFVLVDVRHSLAHHENFDGVLGGAKAAQYPTSLVFHDYYTYLFEYPRSPRVRWLLVFRHSVEMLGCLILMKILVEQYMVVILQNTFVPMESLMKMSIVSIFAHLSERILKLSIPNLFVWLLMFVALFHHWLNILAEITRFADRRFYSDWWNSSSIDEYWRKWNIPIHNFMNLHIYRPLMRRHVSRMWAAQIVFILSALAHEYMVCVPLHIGFTGLVFTGFIAQMPLTLMTSTQFFKDYPVIGNMTFWILFCFTGQPLAIIVYYYLWGVRKGVLEPPRWQSGGHPSLAVFTQTVL